MDQPGSEGFTTLEVVARLEGFIQTVRWDQVAGLVVDDDGLLLRGPDGAVIPLAVSADRNGGSLVAT
jgi:hypothetical protein